MVSNTGVRYGLLGGLVVLSYFILLFSIGQDLFLSPGLQWASMGIYLFFMWQAAKVDCRVNGLERDFREILRTPFVVFLLINLCYWVFYYALHLYDPGLIQTEMAIELQGIKSQIEAGVGDPQQANLLRERMNDLEHVMQSPPSQPLGPIVTRMFIGALGGFSLSAAVAGLQRYMA